MSGGRERSMDAKSDKGRADAGREARGGGSFGGKSMYGGGRSGLSTTNEMAKRLAPRMDVPVNRTVDTAPRGLPNRSNNPNVETVPNYPFASPWRGVFNMLESIGPMGPITAPVKQAFGMTLGDQLGLESGPQVGTTPTQTRSNLPGGSGVGGSVNSGGAIPNPTIANMKAFANAGVPFGPQPTAPTIPTQPDYMKPLPGFSMPNDYQSMLPQMYARQLI